MVWRLQLIEHLVAMLTETLVQDKIVETALTVLVAQASTTLLDLVEVAARAAAEILVETGDVRRFTGTGPIPATSGEGGCHPVRLRLNRGGNRRLSAVLHRMSMIQLRCEPRARALHDIARKRGHTAARPCASSRGTSPTPSTEPCSETPRPPRLDLGASSALGTASTTSRTTDYAAYCTAASPGTLTARRHSEPEHHAWLRRPLKMDKIRRSFERRDTLLDSACDDNRPRHDLGSKSNRSVTRSGDCPVRARAPASTTVRNSSRRAVRDTCRIRCEYRGE